MVKVPMRLTISDAVTIEIESYTNCWTCDLSGPLHNGCAFLNGDDVGHDAPVLEWLDDRDTALAKDGTVSRYANGCPGHEASDA